MLVLLYRFLHKILLVVAKALVESFIIGIGGYGFFGYSFTAELIYRLCKYRFTTLAELAQVVRRGFFEI